MGKLQKPSSGDGFSMVQLLVALALLSIMAAGMYSAGIQALTMIKSNKMLTAAQGFATQKLEELSAAGFDGVVAQYGDTEGWYSEPEPLSSENGKFMMMRTVALIGYDASGTMVMDVNDAVYLQVSVGVGYVSPFTRGTNVISFSTIVLDE